MLPRTKDPPRQAAAPCSARAYVRAWWAVGTWPQGVVACVNGPNPSAAEYSTSPLLTLLYDTLPPVMVTDTAALANATFSPGSSVTLSYSEDLICTRPFFFQIQLVQNTTVGGAPSTQMLYDSGSSLSGSALPLRCAGSDIRLAIPRAIGQKVSLPATVGIVLAKVADLYLNSDASSTTLYIRVLPN